MTAKTIYHRMQGLNKWMMKNYKHGFGPRRVVLLLTTIGRKSGLPREIPLQFELIDGNHYIASARGKDADWFKNIQVNPKVQVRIRNVEFEAYAEPILDPVKIADFIELRLKRHPIMVRTIMHLFDGIPLRFSRDDLEELCKQKALVILNREKPNHEPPDN